MIVRGGCISFCVVMALPLDLRHGYHIYMTMVDIK